MIGRLVIWWDRLRNSLWALPLLIVIASAGLAIVTLNLRLDSGGDPVWWLYSGTATSASGFLSSLLTAMITMATLAISITMVVLALAAQSLGPRLIATFMSDVRTKLSLGLFIGTVAYLLVVLRMVSGESDAVPQLAVTIGTALVIASVTTLLFFVHHLARSIVADTIIGRVGDALDAQIDDVMTEKGRDDLSHEGDLDGVSDPDEGEAIIADSGGYVRYIDHGAIVTIAAEADAIVVLAFRPGQFVMSGETLGWMIPLRAGTPERLNAISALIVRGSERTAVQDLEYSIRQLVEIALRALSPGVNDPYTACAAVDRLATSIARMMRRRPPQTVWLDQGGTPRLRAPQSSLDGIVDASFNQIRQAGAEQPAILIRLADRLGQLLRQCDDGTEESIQRHLHLVAATGKRGIRDEADRKALEQRVADALNQRRPHRRVRAGPPADAVE